MFFLSLLLLSTVSVWGQYSVAKVSPSDLSVGFSAIVGSGESRAANIGIQNNSKQSLKNIVVTVKIQFVQKVKGKDTPGEVSEFFEIKSLKPGATAEIKKHYADQVVRITSAVVESVLQKK